MGTKIIEQGSTAGGIAKVQYLDESGNVLYEVNDSDKIFKMVNSKISSLAGTGTRMVTADASGNLSASGVITKLITQQLYNYTAVYGINYINTGPGGQKITLPVAVSGAEVEIISKTQGVNTFLSMSGSNKIYDINGNDVTSTYTAASALASIKRLRFIGSVQIDRSGAPLNSGAVDWVLVEKNV